MKKTALLNSRLSLLIAELGHGDEICISDAGLPVPNGVERIDLAIRPGLPGLIDCLKAVTSEMQVEKALFAEEFEPDSPLAVELGQHLENLSDAQGALIDVTRMSHENFKQRSQSCKAVIRTGECTPYANIILTAGVAF